MCYAPAMFEEIGNLDLWSKELLDLSAQDVSIASKGIRIDYIQPVKLHQNAYVDRFNRTVRYEWLSQSFCEELDEVRLFDAQWMYNYNQHRSQMALGGFTPKQRLAMAA